jgi:hypothetical protein
MKRRAVILFSLAVLGGFIWFFAGNRSTPAEPVWEGKKLTQWLMERDTNPSRSLTWPARKAIRGMGTNALPFLLNMIGTEDPPAKLKLNLWTSKSSLFKKFTASTHYQSRLDAADGFEALGAKAAPAAPGLIRLLNDQQTEYPAALALGAIGQPAVPLLVQNLTNWNVSIRLPVLQALNFMHGAVDAIPFVLPCLEDAQPAVRQGAAITLGDLHQEPEQVVPKLIERLSDTNSAVRAAAAFALEMFEAHARTAIPKLTELQNDPDAEVRKNAASALIEVQAVSEGRPPSLITNAVKDD